MRLTVEVEGSQVERTREVDDSPDAGDEVVGAEIKVCLERRFFRVFSTLHDEAEVVTSVAGHQPCSDRFEVAC